VKPDRTHRVRLGQTSNGQAFAGNSMSHDNPPTASEALIEEVRQDIACPQCEYNLRGLRGPIVNCPECGQRCDIPHLISRKWTKPWYKAPYYNTICLPLCCAFIALPGTMCAAAIANSSTAITPLFITGVAVLFWIGLLARTWQVFRGMRGVWLALLAHGLMAGYIVGGLGFILALIYLITSILDAMTSVPLASADPLGISIGVAVLPLGIIIIWLSRRGERFIARMCIQPDLHRTPSS
jgi:hypothetical protein